MLHVLLLVVLWLPGCGVKSALALVEGAVAALPNSMASGLRKASQALSVSTPQALRPPWSGATPQNQPQARPKSH